MRAMKRAAVVIAIAGMMLTVGPHPALCRGERVQPADEPRQAPGDSAWTDRFVVDEHDWSSAGINPWFALWPGFQMEYENREENGKLVITVLHQTKVVDGVETRIVEERESEDGQLIEVSRNYFAFSVRTSSIYYFGEDVDIYKDGKVVKHEGAWQSGEKGARFGMLMPGDALLGAKHYQEIAPGEAMDRAEIVSLSETVKTPAGEYKDCLKVEETTPLEPGVKEYKYYARGVGLVVDGGMKLVWQGVEREPEENDAGAGADEGAGAAGAAAPADEPVNKPADQPIVRITKTEALAALAKWEGIDLERVPADHRAEIDSAAASLGLKRLMGEGTAPTESWYFWKVNNYNQPDKYLYLEVMHNRETPGGSGARATVFDATGYVIGSTILSTGWRTDPQEAMIDLLYDGHNVQHIVQISTDAAVGGSNGRQYYALAQDQLHLVRFEEADQGMRRNVYYAPNFTLGPDFRPESVERCLETLKTAHRLELLETLTWLGGVHLDVDPADPRVNDNVSHEDARDAVLAKKCASDARIQAELTRLSQDENAWVREAALQALKPEYPLH